MRIIEFRQVKYLKSVAEADHGKPKLLIRPVHGFKTLQAPYATIKGCEVDARAAAKARSELFQHHARHLRGGAHRRVCLWARRPHSLEGRPVLQ